MLGISIIIPSIRYENWLRVLDSVYSSCTKYPFEIIFVGPDCLVMPVDGFKVRHIKSFASPNTCQQLGLLEAKYDITTHFADDCVFKPGMLDKCIDTLVQEQDNKEHVVLTKYTEGGDTLQNDDYYKLTKAYPKARYIDDSWWIFNSAFFWRTYLIYLGGWDCIFDVPCVAHADLAVRAQRDGCKISFVKESLCHCDHGQNDHMPIEISHGYKDAPIYKELHDNDPDRIRIPLDNWKLAPEVWRRYAK